MIHHHLNLILKLYLLHHDLINILLLIFYLFYIVYLTIKK